MVEFSNLLEIRPWFVPHIQPKSLRRIRQISFVQYHLATNASTLQLGQQAIAAATTNFRLMRAWHDETGLGDIAHPLLQTDAVFFGFTPCTEEQARILDHPISGGIANIDLCALNTGFP